MERTVRVAVVQSAPVLFDKASAMQKIAEWTKEAAKQQAQLVVFPETFVSGYPRGFTFGTRVGSRTDSGRKDWARYWESAVEIPGEDMDFLGQIAYDAGVYLIVGVVEREAESGSSTLYNSMVYIGPDGRLLGKHRKLMPTGAERLLWGSGDGSTLTVIQTPFGRIGGLICWENYMPLARTAMYAKGIDLFITPTADARDTWQATIQHIALEGRCFVLSSNQYATKNTYPDDLACLDELSGQPDVLSRGGSAIVGPLGEYVIKPLWDEEGLLVADLPLDQIVQSRYDFDVMGHYNRPDIFQLMVNEKKRSIVEFQR
ncbi:nitrilase [Paenibacillus naphthalenovorans]|uniref:carbon-nitrogen hydrolase family protein n=1 Tax=Paenibacillus naphthalenovorans TaxID=162209 RepID=UPI0010B4D48E|nr:carbon-nitrogen hydrolase family protein [Paenibacillus naphthalenovorans]GCL73488.1 nitrilase [Paenibacillus naphthalenovorans]